MEVKSVLTHCMKRGSVKHLFVQCIGGEHTSGTAVLWFQILFNVDWVDQEKPVEMV